MLGIRLMRAPDKNPHHHKHEDRDDAGSAHGDPDVRLVALRVLDEGGDRDGEQRRPEHHDARPVAVLDFWELVELCQEAGRLPAPLHVGGDEPEEAPTGGGDPIA